MLRLGLIVCLALIGGCKSAEELAGSGPVNFSPFVAWQYDSYVNQVNPYENVGFAVTADGEGAYWFNCPRAHYRCYVTSGDDVVEQCERGYGQKCYLFADGQDIVWKDLSGWDPEEIAAQAKQYKSEILASLGEDPSAPEWQSSQERQQSYLDRVAESLADDFRYRGYLKAAGHKAIVMRVVRENGRTVVKFGYAYGRDHIEDAMEIALEQCWGRTHSYAYRACDLFDVNGVRVEPVHPDYVSEDLIATWMEAHPPEGVVNEPGSGEGSTWLK